MNSATEKVLDLWVEDWRGRQVLPNRMDRQDVTVRNPFPEQRDLLAEAMANFVPGENSTVGTWQGFTWVDTKHAKPKPKPRPMPGGKKGC